MMHFGRLIGKISLGVAAIVGTITFGSNVASAQNDSAQANADWARWRGPTGNGVAPASNSVPLTWSNSENVVWKVKIPGRGHSSPMIHNGRIYLATADEDAGTQSVLCLDQARGDQLWATVCNTGGLPRKIHAKNTHASATVAIVGNHVIAVFNHHDAIHAIALNFQGNAVWKQKVGPYRPDHAFGYGASPVVAGDLVIVNNENKSQGGMVAYVAATGEEKWRVPRKLPAGYQSQQGMKTSYSTPVVADIGGSLQVLLSGLNHIASYDPQTGQERWKCPVSWDVSCGTMVWDESTNGVFASGGYPTKETLAINADGSGEKRWSTPVKCYEQSLIVVGSHVYGQAEGGIIYCWNAADGKVAWRHRFEGPESASPVAVGDAIFFTNEKGRTLVLKANPKKLEKLAVNQLGDEAFASLAVSNDQIFARVADRSSGRRQEYLYCLGQKSE